MGDFMEKRVAVNHEEDKPEIIIKDKLNKVSKVDNSLLNGDFTNFSKVNTSSTCIFTYYSIK